MTGTDLIILYIYIMTEVHHDWNRLDNITYIMTEVHHDWNRLDNIIYIYIMTEVHHDWNRLDNIIYGSFSETVYQYCDIGTKKSKCFKTPNM